MLYPLEKTIKCLRLQVVLLPFTGQSYHIAVNPLGVFAVHDCKVCTEPDFAAAAYPTGEFELQPADIRQSALSISFAVNRAAVAAFRRECHGAIGGIVRAFASPVTGRYPAECAFIKIVFAQYYCFFGCGQGRKHPDQQCQQQQSTVFFTEKRHKEPLLQLFARLKRYDFQFSSKLYGRYCR